jgi:class 3 adenylate cyclase
VLKETLAEVMLYSDRLHRRRSRFEACRGEAFVTFYDLLEQVLALLQRHQRLSYRALKLQFPLLDPACIDALRDELLFQGVARDAEGQGLIWLGRPSVVPQATGSPPASAAELSRAAPTVSATLPSPATGDDGLAALASGLSAPEAERRQLTVLFCDLVGSTQLSGQLDPEDLRAVVRAYQEAAAEVIARYEGHIAQYLGDGLLVYFGYPTAHEDDARRAVYTGLGIVQAITTLNTRLTAQYGVHLAVRLGIHTGPVVVGVMGGGGRHEHLALGETPNIAARLQTLAPANGVVLSAVTARLVQGTFVL